AVALEYASYKAMVASATQLPHLLPPLSVAWGQHARWLAIPRPLRALAMGPLTITAWATPVAKGTLALALLLLAVWALLRPYPLTIEAEGAYQPVRTRSIYASADGFIEELLVEDAQAVEVGQPLAKLRSPTLDLRLEQVQGELRSCIEEINGIRIALNQLNPDSAELLNQQSRLASKIQELETRQQGLEQQLELLRQDSGRLTLLSPIRGVVLAKDLQQHLTRRPVQRGDPLFSIVDLQGPWQIRVRVADRDSGYVLAHYAPSATPWPAEPQCEHPDDELTEKSRIQTVALVPSAASSNSNAAGPLRQELDFVFDSAPSERHEARIHWIADHVENQHGEGCFVEIRATTSAGGPAAAHAGAGVRAHFYCGRQPLWFVWCRPLVEAAQRRLWFSSL
ncbi:MAG: efflux RND transporter periplasmic adaptor subunit, partial [Planctomycetales bacterium]|nr:efflux RND transporter periplasmic adaptor subunit [Planctomycetales bacterium]